MEKKGGLNGKIHREDAPAIINDSKETLYYRWVYEGRSLIKTRCKPNKNTIKISKHYYSNKRTCGKIAIILKETSYPNIYLCLIDNDKYFIKYVKRCNNK